MFYVAAATAIQTRRRVAVAALMALLVMDVGYAAHMQLHNVEHGVDPTALHHARGRAV